MATKHQIAVAKHERRGYEQAMRDIAAKMVEMGAAYGAAQWIFDNTHPDDEAHVTAQRVLDGDLA